MSLHTCLLSYFTVHLAAARRNETNELTENGESVRPCTGSPFVIRRILFLPSTKTEETASKQTVLGLGDATVGTGVPGGPAVFLKNMIVLWANTR